MTNGISFQMQEKRNRNKVAFGLNEKKITGFYLYLSPE